MKIVIIEDENLAARRLEKLILAEEPSAEIVRRIDSIEDSVEFFSSTPQVDLVFMDIQLADGLSLDIFAQVKITAPVIFTTAFDHYALHAFKVNSVDYLLKPVDQQELKRALERFHELFNRPSVDLNELSEVIKNIRRDKTEYRERFLVKNGSRLVFIGAVNIAYFLSVEGITFLVTHDNERYLVEETLEVVENQMDPRNFFRINRKMILSVKCIDRIEPHFNNRLLLDLKPVLDEEIVVSRHRTAEFKEWLDR